MINSLKPYIDDKVIISQRKLSLISPKMHQNLSAQEKMWIDSIEGMTTEIFLILQYGEYCSNFNQLDQLQINI